MQSFACTTLSPTPSQDPKCPLHKLCLYEAEFPSPKGFLGLREGGGNKKQTAMT